MEERGNRDQMVIATKYTTGFKTYQKDVLQSTSVGNSAKSLRVSLEASLKKLKTDYIDILYVHWWDFTTSIPELMKSLNAAADAGKIIYLGVSDTPAWVVSKANEYARNHGLRQFVVYQGQWSAASRDFERDIIPMVQGNIRSCLLCVVSSLTSIQPRVWLSPHGELLVEATSRPRSNASQVIDPR